MNKYRILRRGRILLALLMLAGIIALFIDIYEWIPESAFESVLWLQFVPSLLHFLTALSLISAGGFILVLLLTLFNGRVYCSVICPLGIFQDVITRISRWRSKKRRFFRFKRSYPLLRYSFLGLMVLAVIFGAGWIVTWLDPYSIAGRTFTYVLRPVAIGVNNYVIVPVLQWFDVYTVYPQELIQPYILPLVLALILIAFISYFAWKRGRLFCNTICPVGTLLGEISRFSFLKVRFDEGKCTRCGKCAGVCKSECIQIKNQSVDHSRCVMCYNCLDICPETALILRPVAAQPAGKRDQSGTRPVQNDRGMKPGFDKNRRKLLVTGLGLLAGQRIYALKKNKLPENQQDLLLNEKDYPVAPPGAGNIDRFNSYCTGCSLCVSVCPTGVLQPALTQYGLSGFMQPHMDYLSSFCNFDCTKCGDVCPTDALRPLSIEDKHLTQLGKAVFVKQNCIVYTDETDCGACSEHCPTKAVKMVPYKNGLLIPEVDDTICIGCGACEYPCPVPDPYKAIYVNGNAEHQLAEKPGEGLEELDVPEEDFPF